MNSEHDPPVDHDIAAYYARGGEAGWLLEGLSRLERARTEKLLGRWLPAPPAVVLDVGGGPGVYACWLAAQGYAVNLIDPIPLHVEQARQAAAQAGVSLAGAWVGDARRLAQPDECAAAALLLGPLYHLTERADRVQALAEARRCLQPGGVLLAAGISRFASLLDGLHFDRFVDPAFGEIVAPDLQDGQHRNPTAHPGYFTTAFFHHPEELRAEVEDAGLRVEALLAIEGPALAAREFARWWEEAPRRAQFLALLRAVEAEPSLLGASPHLLVVGRKE